MVNEGPASESLHVAGVGLAPRRSVVAEDIRDLQNRTPHDRRGLCGRLVTSGLQRGQAIQRAHAVLDGVGGDARVERGRISRAPKERVDIGLIGSSPGNSQTCGRAMRHQSRKSSSNCGESIA
jgi:hypothetical protein